MSDQSDHDRRPKTNNADRGAIFLEYGLLISLIAAVVAVALTLFGPAVAALLSDGLDVLL
jgi:Flp pilus assembly pilin Flp